MSTFVIGPMPERPELIDPQKSDLLFPSDETTPTPVITTLFIFYGLAGNLGLILCGEERFYTFDHL